MKRILIEKHNDTQCGQIKLNSNPPCSYCKNLESHGNHSFGLWSPIDKKWNSWRVFWLVTKKNRWFIRF